MHTEHTAGYRNKPRDIKYVEQIREFVGLEWQWDEVNGGWHFHQVPVFNRTNILCLEWTDGKREYLPGKIN